MTRFGSCFHASFPRKEGKFSSLSYLQLVQPSSSPLHVPDMVYRLSRKEAKSSKPVLEALSLNHSQIRAVRKGLSCALCLHSHECPESCQESGQLPASARSRKFTDMERGHQHRQLHKVWTPSMKSTIAVPHLLLETAWSNLWLVSFLFSYCMWLHEAMTAGAAILTSALVRPLWDKSTAFPQASNKLVTRTRGQGWASPCPRSSPTESLS